MCKCLFCRIRCFFTSENLSTYFAATLAPSFAPFAYPPPSKIKPNRSPPTEADFSKADEFLSIIVLQLS